MTDSQPAEQDYEVAYLLEGETRNAIVRATGPVEAARRFEEDPDNAGAQLICVVRC